MGLFQAMKPSPVAQSVAHKTWEQGLTIHQPPFRTFLVLFSKFFLYLEAVIECNTTSDLLDRMV